MFNQFNAPSLPIFKQLGILKFLDIYELCTYLFVFNFVNGVLPNLLLGIYQYHRDIHEHNAIHSTDPRTPSVNVILWEKKFYIKVQNCGPHWMVVKRTQERSHCSKHVCRLIVLTTTDINLYMKCWNTWAYLTVAIGLGISSDINKHQMHDDGRDISLQ